MKKFKEFLREDDAKAPTTTTAQGDKPPALWFEIPPGYPGSYQEGPPEPSWKPVRGPDGPRFDPTQFDTLEDYIREFDDWFLEEYDRGAFEAWTEEQINEWYKKRREEIERKWKKFQHFRGIDLFPPEHTYA
jgi:hypothetical protein